MTTETSTQEETNTPSSDENLAAQIKELDLSKISKFAHKSGDALFGYIERCQVESSNACFGRFLDAGTGSHSLRWIASVIHRERLLADSNGETAPLVTMTSFTAITADENMRRRVLGEAGELGIADKGEIIIGNWSSGVDRNGEIELDFSSHANKNEKKLLLEGQTFDTILADYLVGAIDGFSPYFQDLIFHRLVPHLAPGGRMYIIGLQPIPDRVQGDANIMCKITKIRDSCILLANHRCYREYPVGKISHSSMLHISPSCLFFWNRVEN